MQIELKYTPTKWDEILKVALQRGIIKSTILVRDDAIKRCPVKTGRLSNSIKRYNKKNQGYVYTNVKYAPVIEFGVKKSYVIRVKNKKVLSDGKVIYGKQVTHPPMKAKPYMRPALYNNKNNILEIVSNEIKKAKA